jgi:uncharacterized DUF497 family protein
MIKPGIQIVFDPDKDEINLKKHRYSLACAGDIISSLLFLQNPKIIFSDGYIEKGEVRCMAMALYQDRVVLFVFTMEDDDMRLISFRDASDKEEAHFWQELNE